MSESRKKYVVLSASCIGVFWPGAFIFGFPGVMKVYWQNTFAVGQGDVGRIIFFVLAAVGCFMFLIGRWQEKAGLPKLAAMGAVICGINTIAVGRIPAFGFVYLWAFLAGLVSCFLYIPTITAVQQWFVGRRGLVSGLVNMAFGLSAAVTTPLFGLGLEHLGYRTTTLLFGIAALGTGLAAAPFIRLPEKAASSPGTSIAGFPHASLTVMQALCSRSFWFLWTIWAIAGAAGIAMVTNSTTFGLSRGLAFHEAIFILTAFNLNSGISRLISGYLSDLVGRHLIMSLTFAAAGGAYWLMPHAGSLVLWLIFASVIGFAFGTMWAVSAPLAGDCFGLKHFGTIFGLLYTAYGFVAGPIGPWLSGHLLDATRGNYSLIFGYLGAFLLASALLIWQVKPGERVQKNGSSQPSRATSAHK